MRDNAPPWSPMNNLPWAFRKKRGNLDIERFYKPLANQVGEFWQDCICRLLEEKGGILLRKQKKKNKRTLFTKKVVHPSFSLFFYLKKGGSYLLTWSWLGEEKKLSIDNQIVCFLYPLRLFTYRKMFAFPLVSVYCVIKHVQQHSGVFFVCFF